MDNDDRSWGQRHPRRKAGMAFLAGSAMGAGFVAKKMRRSNKNSVKKFLNQLGI